MIYLFLTVSKKWVTNAQVTQPKETEAERSELPATEAEGLLGLSATVVLGQKALCGWGPPCAWLAFS